jgi:hypothetical protein
MSEAPLAKGDKLRLTEALVDMLERFDPLEPQSRVAGDSGAERTQYLEDLDAGRLMTRLAQRLRYTGALLSEDELRRLEERVGRQERRRDSDAELALRWHALTRRFSLDRRLPTDFVEGPTRWQLATLAWSFHVENEPTILKALEESSPEEIVHALAEVLAVDVPLPATSLSGQFSGLDDYRRFLSRLPRR